MVRLRFTVSSIQGMVGLIVFTLLGSCLGCSDGVTPAEEEYLLRVGSHDVGVEEFERAFEISKSAYLPESEVKPELLA